MRNPGFTLIELIVVIVLVGIVALIAAPRFFSQPTFDAARFHDAAISAIRFGQKVAVAQRTTVYVALTPNTVALCYNTGCSTPVLSPADSAAFIITAPNNIALAGTSFSFTSLGQPASFSATPVALAASTTLNISGDGGARQIVVERETGYVHK